MLLSHIPNILDSLKEPAFTFRTANMSQSPPQPRSQQFRHDDDVLVPSDSVIRRVSIQNPGLHEISENAALAASAERDQTFWQAVKMYPRAIGWSILLSTAIVMEGYDTLLLSNLYGLPQFQNRYGELQPDGRYVLPRRVALASDHSCKIIPARSFFQSITSARKLKLKMIGEFDLTNSL